MKSSLLALFVAMLAGCSAEPPSLYDRMNAAVRPGDGLQQTQLAHIGHIDTADGRYEVAVQRLVLTGMLAPRGQRHLRLFTTEGRPAATYWLPDAEPLWCEGGRVYLAGFGRVGSIPVEPQIAAQFAKDELPTGNVIDFSRGIGKAIIVRETRYGSSGGIEDVADVQPAAEQ